MENEKSSIDVVMEHLDQDEILAQLAEEASELAQAALKLRRAYNRINPTPVTPHEAYERLLEEIADVNVCIISLELDRGLSMVQVQEIMKEKVKRWAARLEDSR